MDEKIIIVMPAYNAERTLVRVFEQIPSGCYDELILVDDCSSDGTVALARTLPITVIEHEENRGYGRRQQSPDGREREGESEVGEQQARIARMPNQIIGS